MSYEMLTGIVFVNCAVTLWLWAALKNTARIKADTPPSTVLNEKIAKEFWDGKPISPPPEPPDAAVVIKTNLSSIVNRNLGEFFQDFEQFVHVANNRFAEYGKYGDFPFRLKDLPATENQNRIPIRRFQIFHNRTAVGELDISTSFYDRVNYHASIDFRISRPRWIKYTSIVDFIDTIGDWVAGPTPSEWNEGRDERSDETMYVSTRAREKLKENRLTIELEMLKTLWSNYAYDHRYSEPDYFGELEVRLDGSAYFYIEVRDRLLPIAGARGRKPDPRFNDRGPFRRDN